jgi:hypothetical protein
MGDFDVSDADVEFGRNHRDASERTLLVSNGDAQLGEIFGPGKASGQRKPR